MKFKIRKKEYSKLAERMKILYGSFSILKEMDGGNLYTHKLLLKENLYKFYIDHYKGFDGILDFEVIRVG